MKKHGLLVGFLTLGAILCFLGNLNASSIPIPATGQGLTNAGDPDLNWYVNSNPAQLLTPSAANWYGGWLGNGPNSNWIGKTATTPNNGPAPYTFNCQFDLSAFVLSTVSISGLWTIDDAGDLTVNGHLISSLSGGNWGGLNSFSLAAGSGYLNPGLNTLSITMTSSDNNWEGVRLEGSITGDLGGSPVPVPGTMLLLGSGLLGLAGLGRRKKGGTNYEA